MRTVELRRAISSAYYALLQELVRRATRRTVSDEPEREADRNAVSRWYSHIEIKSVSQWVISRSAGRTLPQRIGMLLDQVPPTLVEIAYAFLDLQEARHDADYDHTADVTVLDTRRHIDRAREALAHLVALDGDRVYDNYLMLLLGGPKLAAR